MDIAHIENLNIGDCITFLKSPRSYVKVYNQFTNQIDLLETSDANIVGNIFEIVAIEIPFIILSNVINGNSFTFDMRNGGKMAIPSKDYVDIFKKQFAQNLNPCIIQINNMGSGGTMPPPPPPLPPFSDNPV